MEIMRIWLIVQLLFIGLMCGYSLYNKDHNIKIEKTEPASLLFWVIWGLLMPLGLIWIELMDSIDEIRNKKK